MVPGSRSLAFVSRWFDPAIVHRTFEPLIADWQREWYDSTPARRPWVSVRASVAFACAAAISSPRIIFTPAPPAMALRVATRIALFSLITGVALSIPMVRSMEQRSMEPVGLALLMLLALPATLAMAFPFAMVIAVDAIRRDPGVFPHVERAAAVKLALIATLFMLTVGGMLAPVAGQEWRERATPAGWNTPEPTFRELSTLALLAHPDRSGAIVPRHYTRAGEIRRELINRSFLSIVPAMFVWLRWAALSVPRGRRCRPLPASVMTVLVIVGFFATMLGGFMLERELAMKPGSGFVVPLIVFGAWTLVEQRSARRAWRDQSAGPQEA